MSERSPYKLNYNKQIKRAEIEAKAKEWQFEREAIGDILIGKILGNFCEMLLHRQKKMGLSDKSFADYLDIPQTTLAPYLKKDVTDMKVYTFIKIMRRLGLPFEFSLDNLSERQEQKKREYIWAGVDRENFGEEENEVVWIRTLAYDIAPQKDNFKAIKRIEEAIHEAYDKAFQASGIALDEFIQALDKTDYT